MRLARSTPWWLAGVFALVQVASSHAGDTSSRVDFNRQIRPILSESCYQCHGPDQNKRKANLRLDRREGLFRSEDGTTVVVPGKPGESEMVERITSDNPDLQMPPPKGGARLTPEQVRLISRWVEEGAEWKGHWAYLAPERPTAPVLKPDRAAAGEIDRFVRAGLAASGLEPSPPADRRTLIRRLSFDLTGLPPAPGEAHQFENDRSGDSYERLVDRLLASPHFGERMAIFWLDLVRFADTTGYHGDNHVDIYLFRDYVIRSFNANKPFDRFTVRAARFCTCFRQQYVTERSTSNITYCCSSRLREEFNSRADSSRACKPDRLKLELMAGAAAVFERFSQVQMTNSNRSAQSAGDGDISVGQAVPPVKTGRRPARESVSMPHKAHLVILILAQIYLLQPLRYTCHAGPLENLVTQPYDKISPAMRARYLTLSPYNLVRVILGERSSG